MSPAKPRSTFTERGASAIPRRVKQSTATKLQKPLTGATSKPSSVKPGSIFADESVNISPPRSVSYQNTAGANKENIPATITGGRLTYNGVSPSRQPIGVSKFSKGSLSALKKQALARVPLRELNEQEVYERDEAILGELRRRRSGDHRAFEVDSVLAGPSLVNHGARASSICSSSTNTSNSSQSTAATEVDDDEGCSEKIRVLKRSDSEEKLREKINAILENTASAKAKPDKTCRRKGLLTKPSRLTPVKPQHPAIRQSSSPRSNTRSEAPSSPGDAFSGSPHSSPLKMCDLPESPLRILRSPSPIVRVVDPPSVRMGLETKAINTFATEKKAATGDKPKKVIISSNTAQPKKKLIRKNHGSSSLRRAAGPVRPASATTGRLTGLEEMRKMR